MGMQVSFMTMFNKSVCSPKRSSTAWPLESAPQTQPPHPYAPAPHAKRYLVIRKDK